jgi:hypothetical protein
MLMPERLRQQSLRHDGPVEACEPPSADDDGRIQTRDTGAVNAAQVRRAVFNGGKSKAAPDC